MGSLRLILALAVVLAHCWPGGGPLLDSANAVRLFYMISGFLISFILTGRKSYNRIGDFYLNRYLRLYPAYAVVALLTLMISAPGLVRLYHHFPIGAKALLVSSNALIFGQDWVMFAAVKDGALAFTGNFYDSDRVLAGGLLVPPAWTLGLELSFYALAPFVLPRRWLMWSLLVLSIAVRVFLAHLGMANRDPWSYRFFPAELSLFLIGAIAHQIILPRFQKLSSRTLHWAAIAATIFAAAFCVFYSAIAAPENLKSLTLLLLFIPVLPLIFIFQNNYPWDKRVGELSYPLYIGHWLMIVIVQYLARGLIKNDLITACICVVAALLFALALDFAVIRPVERVRIRIRQRAKT